MSWDDYVFEDPWESYDRSQEEYGYFGAEYRSTFIKNKVSRICSRCTYKFSSTYPSACPKCGGWTDAAKGT